MSYRCTMSRIRWFSGPAVLTLALAGTACRSESERAEGAVREPGDQTIRKGEPPPGPNQPSGKGLRDQAGRVGDKAEQLAQESKQLGQEAREQAERVGNKAEQLAQQGKELGQEAREKAERAGNKVNDQMNKVGEQTGALKDNQGAGARPMSAPPAAPKDQAAPQTRQQGQAEEAKNQAGHATAAAHDAWMKAAKDDDYQVTFGRDGSVIATKEAKKGTGARPSDEALRNAVSGELADSDHDAVKKLHVTVRDGVVTLQGTVASVKEATEAVKEALDADGVTKVISYIRYGT
ncbi:BON domain-containing protein [Sorangium sp. So ce1000]|jgi:osmotically-inducible protein OsmY|uniref:BON domain-containing protein n=1 Tax=Sorangium sp. So ce1000 TaxID=3133325 RepID=UPI003F5DAD20